MPDIAITPLQTAEDLDQCAKMMSETEPWKTLGRDYLASRKSIGDPAKEVYLARTGDNQIVGFTVLNMQGAFVGYVQSLCAAEKWRGQGIGTSLLSYAEARIFRDSPNVFMCVSSFNPAARRLYERLGYLVIGEIKDYVIANHSEFLLRKTIAPLNDFIASRQT